DALRTIADQTVDVTQADSGILARAPRALPPNLGLQPIRQICLFGLVDAGYYGFPDVNHVSLLRSIYSMRWCVARSRNREWFHGYRRNAVSARASGNQLWPSPATGHLPRMAGRAGRQFGAFRCPRGPAPSTACLASQRLDVCMA